PGKERGQRAPAANGVAIEPAHPCAGTRRPHLVFDALGAEAGLLEIRPAAQRTRLWHAGRVVAVVAACAARRAFAVDDQRDAAIRTVDGSGAVPAEHGRRKTAAVEEHEHLIPPIEPRTNRVAQRAAEDHARALRRVP